MKWPVVLLGELFDISSSKRVLQRDWKTEGVPFYRAREIVKLAKNGYVENDLFITEEHYIALQKENGTPKKDDLMISAVGTLGACYLVGTNDRFYYKDASVLRFSPKTQLCSKYFVHAFQTSLILDQVNAGGGATVGTYTIERAKKTKIALPPLAEQQRIAALLDTADRILKQRESAIAKLENLIRSYFEEISSKDELVELGSVVELKYGKSLPSQNRRVGKYNVYGSNGVVGSHIESITSGETIIVGRKGSFGEINLSLESCFPIDTTYYIDKSATKQNIVWLRYALETLKLNTLNKSAAVPGLNREDAYRQKLQLIGRSLQNDFEIYARKVWEIIKIQNDFICKHKKLIASIQHQSFAVN